MIVDAIGLADIGTKIIVSAASTVALLILSLLFRSIRGFVFYTRAEYDLVAERRAHETPFCRSWSINWEENRLDLAIGDISNNSLNGVRFENATGRRQDVANMHPSNSFVELFDGALGAKINSIVRQNRPSGEDVAIYTLRLVIRRKRWAWAI
ncbi:hypothetical protein UNPF46_00595 [Bradyrhizobium sp. UNPF46]|uniref:hypothetical protein n=1 Tax=Bradyrhizobium sp. UNPF46 TaxID=1141168 RepID=UPI00114E9C9F|nr:hypothetical protein [Bradyrhizobium sp. UNPF46]TQF43844.1 hypothetical protein UNPF46_00595 [Bradyrhizobium sp. UNPF46]